MSDEKINQEGGGDIYGNYKDLFELKPNDEMVRSGRGIASIKNAVETSQWQSEYRPPGHAKNIMFFRHGISESNELYSKMHEAAAGWTHPFLTDIGRQQAYMAGYDTLFERWKTDAKKKQIKFYCSVLPRGCETAQLMSLGFMDALRDNAESSSRERQTDHTEWDFSDALDAVQDQQIQLINGISELPETLPGINYQLKGTQRDITVEELYYMRKFLNMVNNGLELNETHVENSPTGRKAAENNLVTSMAVGGQRQHYITTEETYRQFTENMHKIFEEDEETCLHVVVVHGKFMMEKMVVGPVLALKTPLEQAQEKIEWRGLRTEGLRQKIDPRGDKVLHREPVEQLMEQLAEQYDAALVNAGLFMKINQYDEAIQTLDNANIHQLDTRKMMEDMRMTPFPYENEKLLSLLNTIKEKKRESEAAATAKGITMGEFEGARKALADTLNRETGASLDGGGFEEGPYDLEYIDGELVDYGAAAAAAAADDDDDNAMATVKTFNELCSNVFAMLPNDSPTTKLGEQDTISSTLRGMIKELFMATQFMGKKGVELTKPIEEKFKTSNERGNWVSRAEEKAITEFENNFKKIEKLFYLCQIYEAKSTFQDKEETEGQRKLVEELERIHDMIMEGKMNSINLKPPNLCGVEFVLSNVHSIKGFNECYEQASLAALPDDMVSWDDVATHVFNKDYKRRGKIVGEKGDMIKAKPADVYSQTETQLARRVAKGDGELSRTATNILFQQAEGQMGSSVPQMGGAAQPPQLGPGMLEELHERTASRREEARESEERQQSDQQQRLQQLWRAPVEERKRDRRDYQRKVAPSHSLLSEQAAAAAAAAAASAAEDQRKVAPKSRSRGRRGRTGPEKSRNKFANEQQQREDEAFERANKLYCEWKIYRRNYPPKPQLVPEEYLTDLEDPYKGSDVITPYVSEITQLLFEYGKDNGLSPSISNSLWNMFLLGHCKDVTYYAPSLKTFEVDQRLHTRKDVLNPNVQIFVNSIGKKNAMGFYEHNTKDLINALEDAGVPPHPQTLMIDKGRRSLRRARRTPGRAARAVGRGARRSVGRAGRAVGRAGRAVGSSIGSGIRSLRRMPRVNFGRNRARQLQRDNAQRVPAQRVPAPVRSEGAGAFTPPDEEVIPGYAAEEWVDRPTLEYVAQPSEYTQQVPTRDVDSSLKSFEVSQAEEKELRRALAAMEAEGADGAKTWSDRPTLAAEPASSGSVSIGGGKRRRRRNKTKNKSKKTMKPKKAGKTKKKYRKKKKTRKS